MSGPAMLLRQQAQNLRYMRPWQQLLLAAGLIVGGVGLVLVGVHLGVAAFVVGVRMLWGIGRRRWIRPKVSSRV